MNDLPQEILTRIDALAATLGTTVEALWPAMVAAVRYRTIGVWLGGVALIAIGVWGTKRLLRPDADWDDVENIPAAVIGAMTALGLAIVLLSSGVALANIVAPEAAAARELLEALK